MVDILDRRRGLSSGVAFKPPCRLATTANITLSGLQTIDGVTTVADDRVLVKDQTTGSANGIYVADSGPWVRAVDFNGPRDSAQGTLVMVVEGSANGVNIFELTTATPVIGTSSLAFSAIGAAALTAAATLILATASLTQRTLANRFADVTNVHDYGAVGDGTTSDTASYVAALAAGYYIVARGGLTYPVKDLVFGTSKTFDGRGALLKAATGAARLFTLSGYNPYLKEVYVSDNTASSGPVVEINGYRLASVQDLTIVNADGGAILLRDTGAIGVALPNINDIHAEQVIGTGIEIQHSVSEMKATNIHMAGIVDYVVGLGKPRAGTLGWRQNTPVTNGFSVGGHQVTNANMSTCQTGWHITDAQLSKYTNCVGDSCTGYALKIDGASDRLDFTDFFAGTSLGIIVSGTAQNILFNGLRTTLNGVIPPWGQASYFDSAGPYYDVTLTDTAKVTINGDAWAGNKRVSVASTATLEVTGGSWFRGRSVGTVAGGATTYLTDFDDTATEADAVWRAPYAGYLFMLRPLADGAPGAGETFVYTVRLDGSDTALTATISNPDTFSRAYGPITVAEGQQISIKLVTSATATARRHRVSVQMLGL